ncbi:MAG: hypothetical protein JF616_18215 [Fibrobacteres bacterium]|nr:hypothetical protein [Fibrobacterota bacterium]
MKLPFSSRSTAWMLFLLPASIAQAATLTVSKDGRGAFTTVQAAVDRAGKRDIVLILDAAVYPEQVTIDSTKNGLELRSSDPTATAKPTIRYQDVIHQHPKTCQEALNAATIDYEENGALRLIGTTNVSLDGIAVDGGGPAPFSNPNVWGNGVSCTGTLYPLFHGNAALVLSRTSQTSVRDCAFTNAFFGVWVRDYNLIGAFSDFPQNSATAWAPSPPGFAGTGGHLFENDLFANNSFGAAGAELYGLPSTFRNNWFFANGHTTQSTAKAVYQMPDGSNYPGGAFYFSGDLLCPWIIEHNTFQSNAMIFCGGYRPNGPHLAQANLIGPPLRYSSLDTVFGAPFQETFGQVWKGLRCNLVAGQVIPPEKYACKVQFSAYDSVAAKNISVDTIVANCGNFPVMYYMPYPETRSDTIGRDLVSGNRTFHVVKTIPRGGPTALLLDTAFGVEASRLMANHWWEPSFAGIDPAAAGFLEPQWPASVPADLRPTDAPYRNVRGETALPGRIPLADQAASALRVIPVGPAVEVGGELELSFEIQAPEATSDLQVANLVPVQIKSLITDGFGYTRRIADSMTFYPASLPSATLQAGFNRIRLARPWSAGGMGLAQMLVRGRLSDGKPAYGNWTAFPCGIIRKEIGISLGGTSGTGPMDAPASGKMEIALTLPANLPASTKILLIRLSGQPILRVPTSGDPVTLGWMNSSADPIPVLLPGDPAQLRYDGVIAISDPPGYTGLSPLLRYPGALAGAAPAKPRFRSGSRSGRLDALGRRLPPFRHRTPSTPVFAPRQSGRL